VSNKYINNQTKSSKLKRSLVTSSKIKLSYH